MVSAIPEPPGSESGFPETSQAEEFRLRPTARLGWPLASLGIAVIWLVAPISFAYWTPRPLLFVLGLVAVVAGPRFWIRSRRPRAVRCGTDDLAVPGLWRTARIRLAKVHALYRRGDTLVVSQSGRAVSIALACRQFVEASALERLEALLLERIERAGVDLAALARRRAVARTARSVPLLTGALALGLIAVFALEIATDAMSTMRGLIERGAVAPVLVARGEWWRVLSGTRGRERPPPRARLHRSSARAAAAQRIALRAAASGLDRLPHDRGEGAAGPCCANGSSASTVRRAGAAVTRPVRR